MSLEDSLATIAAAIEKLTYALSLQRSASEQLAQIPPTAAAPGTLGACGGSPTPPSAPSAPSAPPTAPVDQAAPGDTVTYDDLKRPFIELAKRRGVPAALALLKPYGVHATLAQIVQHPEHYTAAKAALLAALTEG